MNDSPALLPLKEVNWDSHTCDCKVEVRRYHIYKTPSEIIEHQGNRQVVPERIWCNLHKLDGSIEEIPMVITTIEEMLESGLQLDYWKDARRRQIQQIENIELLLKQIAKRETPQHHSDPAWINRFGGDSKLAATLPGPRDMEGWEGALWRVNKGKTYADLEGYRRSPGTQMRGHLSYRCPLHHNQTSTSLMEQRIYKSCGCVVGQITVGERREEGVNHERYYHFCDWHGMEWEKAQKRAFLGAA